MAKKKAVAGMRNAPARSTLQIREEAAQAALTRKQLTGIGYSLLGTNHSLRKVCLQETGQEPPDNLRTRLAEECDIFQCSECEMWRETDQVAPDSEPQLCLKCQREME